jgi:hypothetical protein
MDEALRIEQGPLPALPALCAIGATAQAYTAVQKTPPVIPASMLKARSA